MDTNLYAPSEAYDSQTHNFTMNETLVHVAGLCRMFCDEERDTVAALRESAGDID